MKHFYLLFSLFFFTNLIQAQYLEEFDVADKGILGACSGSTLPTCSPVDFAGVNWTLGGDLSGVDAGDGLSTTGGFLHFQDTDEAACFISPSVTISGSPLSSFTVDFRIPSGSWEDSGSDVDFADVSFSVDGGAFILVPNVHGCPASGHTIGSNPGGCGALGPQTFLVTVPNIIGSSLVIMVCCDTNSFVDDGDLHSVSVTGGVVPVTWSKFKAKSMAEGNLLEWSTASELNNDRFEIERSINTANDFKVIAREDGAGTTAEEKFYSFLDKDITSGTVYYYRIKQIDFDGKNSFSNLLSVQTERDLYTINPNPFSDQVTISFTTSQENRTVRIYNAQGVLVKEMIANSQKDLSIDLQDLAAGIYYLSADNEAYKKIVKSN